MRKHTLIVTLALVVAAASGCSSSDSSKVEEAEAVSDTAAKKSAEKEELDHPVRSEDNQFVTFETNFGNMTLELYHDVAPAHADSRLFRGHYFPSSRQEFYDPGRQRLRRGQATGCLYSER